MATDTKQPIKSKKTGKKKKSGAAKKKDHRTLFQEEQTKYYHRLLHSAQKSLRKQAKTVRNFECQKWIRRIKDSKKEEDASSMQASYQEMKQLDLELVVQECLRRLGILHLDPKAKINNNDNNNNMEEDDDGSDNDKEEKDDEKEEDNSDKEEVDTATNHSESAAPPPMIRELVEKLLKHKRLQSALEEWNEQVTEYRRWCLQKQAREDQPRFLSGSNTTTASQKKKKAKNKKKKETHDDGGLHVLTDTTDQSLFVQLGATDAAEDDDDNSGEDNDPYQNPYGPGTYLADEDQQPKKNRKGQRARRAKAMAIEAKKAGRLHKASDSVNWRQPKDRSQQQQDNNSQHQSNNRGASSHSHHNQQQPPQEELHPSWAAAKKKDSIVKFQGTKITF